MKQYDAPTLSSLGSFSTSTQGNQGSIVDTQNGARSGPGGPDDPGVGNEKD